MRYQILLYHCCLPVIWCFIPDARSGVRDEQVVGSVEEHYKNLSLDPIYQGTNPSKDQTIQPYDSDSAEASSYQPVVSLSNLRNRFRHGNLKNKFPSEGTVGPLEDTTRSARFNPLRDELTEHSKVQPETKSRFQDMKIKWDQRPAEVILHTQDSTDISNLISSLRRKLKLLQEYQAHDIEAVPQGAIEFFSRSLNLVEEVNEGIVQFKQIRLAQLSDVQLPQSDQNLLSLLISGNSKAPQTTPESLQHIPTELVGVISSFARKNYGDSIVKQMRDVIAIDDTYKGLSESTASHYAFTLQQTGLKIIDFLIKNKFATPESVKQNFHDFAFMKNVVKHTEDSYDLTISDTKLNLWSFSLHLTESWYWKFLHNSFQVLGEEEEETVNFYSLLSLLKNHFLSKKDNESPEWLSFYGSSLIRQLSDKIEMNSYPRIGKKPDKFIDFHTESRIVVNLIGAYYDKRGPNYLFKCGILLTLLELMEKYFSPGLLKEVIENHPESQLVKTKFKTIQLEFEKQKQVDASKSYSHLHQNLSNMYLFKIQPKKEYIIDTLDKLDKLYNNFDKSQTIKINMLAQQINS